MPERSIMGRMICKDGTEFLLPGITPGRNSNRDPASTCAFVPKSLTNDIKYHVHWDPRVDGAYSIPTVVKQDGVGGKKSFGVDDVPVGYEIEGACSIDEGSIAVIKDVFGRKVSGVDDGPVEYTNSFEEQLVALHTEYKQLNDEMMAKADRDVPYYSKRFRIPTTKEESEWVNSFQIPSHPPLTPRKPPPGHDDYYLIKPGRWRELLADPLHEDDAMDVFWSQLAGQVHK